MLLNGIMKVTNATNVLVIFHCLRLKNPLKFGDWKTPSSSNEGRGRTYCGGPFKKKQSASLDQCTVLKILVMYITIYNYQNSFEVQELTLGNLLYKCSLWLSDKNAKPIYTTH
jgi:hypothetical protein